MVKMNTSKCVDTSQVPIILKRIERIKSDATIIKKEGKENELQKIMERP